MTGFASRPCCCCPLCSRLLCLFSLRALRRRGVSLQHRRCLQQIVDEAALSEQRLQDGVEPARVARVVQTGGSAAIAPSATAATACSALPWQRCDRRGLAEAATGGHGGGQRRRGGGGGEGRCACRSRRWRCRAARCGCECCCCCCCGAHCCIVVLPCMRGHIVCVCVCVRCCASVGWSRCPFCWPIPTAPRRAALRCAAMRMAGCPIRRTAKRTSDTNTQTATTLSRIPDSSERVGRWKGDNRDTGASSVASRRADFSLSALLGRRHCDSGSHRFDSKGWKAEQRARMWTAGRERSDMGMDAAAADSPTLLTPLLPPRVSDCQPRLRPPPPRSRCGNRHCMESQTSSLEMRQTRDRPGIRQPDRSHTLLAPPRRPSST